LARAIDLGVKVTGDKEVRLFLLGMRRRGLAGLVPWLAGPCTDYLLDDTLENFRRGGRPNRWPPLRESTKAQRIAQGFPPGPVLIRSGTLMRSATQKGFRGAAVAPGYYVAAANIHRVRPFTLTLGTTHVGGYYAQTGRRPFIWPQQETVKNLIRSCRRFIADGSLVKGPPWR
jgi:hypothetical protein